MNENKLPKTFEWINRMKKYEGNPIIRPNGKWAADLVFNPAAIVKDDQVLLLCRAVNLADKRRSVNWSISSLIWARSKDGIHFELDDEPFLYPDENSEYTGGFEDPRIVYISEEKLYLLTYTGVKWNEDGSLNAPASSPYQKIWKIGSFWAKSSQAVPFALLTKRLTANIGDTTVTDINILPGPKTLLTGIMTVKFL